jgi:hypothetical protein
MSSDRHQPAIQRIVRKITSAFAEANYAQRRMLELSLAPDRHTFAADTAPDTYAEFLYRTSGLLRHERPARARLSGTGTARRP